MGRLTDKELFDALNEHEKDCCRCRERICTYESDRYNCLQDKDKKAYKELAEYRRLEEQGLLLKLPCKVGDTVYKIYDDIYAFTVTDIYLSKETIVIIIAGKELKLSISLSVDDFCEYVFLTKEEAEKALTELTGE